MRWLWFLILIPACTPASPVARLADLPKPQITGVETGFGIEYDASVDCFELSSDVTGTVDGKSVSFMHGGWRSTPDGNTCDGIGANFPAPLANKAVTSIELTDGDTTWAFGVEGLAPPAWTVTAPAVVTEGGDFTVSVAPAAAGVAITSVFIEPDMVGVIPFAATPSGAGSVHIDAGYWSSEDEAPHGGTLTATLEVELGPLVIQGCTVPAGCEFSTHTPDPARSVTVDIP